MPPRPAHPFGALPLRLGAGALLGALLLGPLAQAQSSAANPAQTPVLIEVSSFEVKGNTLLPAALIDSTLAPFKGRRSLEELQAAATAVQRLYVSEGYGAVLAVLPPQTPRDGRISIQVVEGKLARLQVDGAQRTPRAQVLASLPALVPGRTPRLRDLDRQLQMVNDNAARHTEVLLKPGERSGEVDAAISITESPVQRWSLELDNSGTPATGRMRVGLGWRHADLTGSDDLLSLQALTSVQKPDQVKVLSAGYRRPWYGGSTMLEVFGSYSDVDGGITPTVVGNLQFNGRGRMIGVRAARLLPRWGEVDQRLTLGLDQRAYLNQCDISGLPAGACGAAGESVTVQPLVLEYAARAAGDTSWALSLSLLRNLALGGSRSSAADFEAVRPGARRHYAALRLNVSVSQTVLEEWSLLGRVAAQWTPDALVPGEQFGLGGANLGRGYEEREISGDRGVFAALEFTSPAIRAIPLPDFRLTAFADGGSVSSVAGAQCLPGQSECQLASVGLAARLGDARTQMQLSAGQALRAGARTAQDKLRLHFTLSHQF